MEWTVFARFNPGVMGSNSTQAMDVCVRLLCVCVIMCVGSGIPTGSCPFQGVLPTVYNIKKLKSRTRSTRGVWLSNSAVRVRAQVGSCGICGRRSGTGARFVWVHWFPLPILIPPTAPHSSSMIRGWNNRPVSGRRTKWTQSHPTPRN
jgi:hypothetical protein